MNRPIAKVKLRSLVASFEELESRNLLATHTAVLSGGIAGASIEEKIRLSTVAETTTDQQYVEIVNESSFKARFAMQVNGNISRNLSHLVQQIRGMEFTDDRSLPDYERAYHYMLQFHQHDFPLTGRTWSHEPSLYLNALSAGLCDDSASVLAGIWREMGYDSRVWLLSGHVVSEVYTGERWQMYDADLRIVYYNDDGQVAGVEELASDASIIRQPYRPTSEDPYLYSRRMASFFTSVEDNRICAACNEYTSTGDLVFEIPAGGSISWGQTYSSKTLPTVHLDTATKLGQLKVTIPAGSTGSLDIPLPIYDIRGAPTDSIDVSRAGGTQSLKLGGDDAFDFLSRDVREGSRLQAIEFENNVAAIEVIYFFNEQFAEVLHSNLIEIDHATELPAALCVSSRVKSDANEQARESIYSGTSAAAAAFLSFYMQSESDDEEF